MQTKYQIGYAGSPENIGSYYGKNVSGIGFGMSIPDDRETKNKKRQKNNLPSPSKQWDQGKNSVMKRRAKFPKNVNQEILRRDKHDYHKSIK